MEMTVKFRIKIIGKEGEELTQKGALQMYL